MSIRARLLLIVLLATLLTAVVVARRFILERESDIAAATQRLPLLASRIASDLGDKIRGTEQLQFGLARANDLATNDRSACSAFLQRVRDAYPQYTGILTIRPDGQLFCDSLNTGRTLDLTDREYFKRAKVANDVLIMEPAFGRLTGLPVLQIARPVRNDAGALTSVLLASLDLRKFSLASFRDVDLPEAEILLLDRKGTLLASAPAGNSATPGSSIAGSALFRFAAAHAGGDAGEIMGADGKTRVWAAADTPLLRESGLHVLVGHSKSLLTAAANRRFAEDMAVLAAFALLVVLVAWFFAEKSIRRPIGTIADMVRRLGKNEPGIRIPEPHPRGELGDLMKVLNETAQAQERQRAAIRDLDGKLRQSQRLESVGQLTGGIAHDFNNLLTVILGNAEVLHEKLAGEPRLAAMAEVVMSAAGRGADLTQRLLAFARKQPLEPSAVDANQLVADMDALLRRTLGEHIEIEFTRGAQLWRALVDPVQLDNALLNLCLNARDAMPQGGRLTIETANKSLGQDDTARDAELRPGDYVMLAVSDTGTGIAPQDLERVFEPFFTTKPTGKGTGLGLSMLYGFAKQSGGHVSIYSELGEGTTVRLYLPRAADQATPASAAAAAPLAGGSETILLVEDDALVRRFANEQLAALGYRVIEAPDGARALEIIRSDTAIDLLFTDVVMPGLGGRQLADLACALRPALKVLYTSGYTENAVVHQGRLDPGVQLLTKPYRREELARRVRGALNMPPAAA